VNISKNTALTKYIAKMAMLNVFVFLSIHGRKIQEKIRAVVSMIKRPMAWVMAEPWARPMKAPLTKMYTRVGKTQ